MFPFTVAYEGAGTWELSAGQKRWIGDVIVELHMARKDLPRDVAKAAYYSDKVPNAILKEFTSDLLGGTTEAITSINSSGIVFMQYNTAQGAGEHLGIIYFREYQINFFNHLERQGLPMRNNQKRNADKQEKKALTEQEHWNSG
jgi:hypothetical protein